MADEAQSGPPVSSTRKEFPMASSRSWTFDDDDRPSGSVRPLSQADLQAILAQLADDPDGLLAGTGADRPVVAVRVQATVGRPGGSAQARWRRARAGEWAVWTRSLPWRVAASLGIGAASGVLGSLVVPRLSLMIGGLAAVVAGWGLRFKPSPDAVAWRRGAAGERRTARLLDLLERHGWAVLHDLAVPGSAANIDHLAIGPGGVFVIDSKQYRGRLQLDGSGRLWHGRYPLTPTLRAVSFEADQAAQVLPDPGVVVVPIVAVHGVQVPWGKVVADGVPVVAARGGVLGLEVLAADPAGDRPGRVLLGADPERPGWLAAAGHLEPLAGLPGGLLPVAVLTVLSLALALATEEPQAAEGVAVQPDRRPQVGEGVGVVGQGLLGELDLGEADHRMRPLAVWPGQAELAGQGDELALVWYLPPREVSLTPRTWARAWTASCSMVCRVWQEPSARHSPETNSSGRRQAQSGAWALFGGVAFDPVVGAEVAPFGVDVQGAGGESGAGHHDHLGELGGAVADVGPGLFEGGDEAGAGGLDGGHRTSSKPSTCGDGTPVMRDR
jgi:Nuclease-related domain